MGKEIGNRLTGTWPAWRKDRSQVYIALQGGAVRLTNCGSLKTSSRAGGQLCSTNAFFDTSKGGCSQNLNVQRFARLYVRDLWQK
jgi:hypothetical protein